MKQGKDGWLELDISQDMTQDTLAAYEQYKAVYRQAQAAKAMYEEAMIEQLGDDLDEGQTLVFGYNFGKASIKVVAKGEVKAKAQAQPKKSLAEFLREQAAGGRQ